MASRGLPPSFRSEASEIWKTPQVRVPLGFGTMWNGSRDDWQSATATARSGTSRNTERTRCRTRPGDQVSILVLAA